MTLLISLTAAVISTAVWYRTYGKTEMHIGMLCWMFWGASIMWFVDAVFEFIELREEHFQPALSDMLNDAFLGLSVVVLALVVWVIALLIKDPKRVFSKNKQ